MKMLLIAGHGAGDPGAVGNGKSECNLTRNLCTLIMTENAYLDADLEIELYPTTKDCYQESKSGRVPNYAAYDYVLEVHFNSFSSASAYGSEILIHPSETGHTVEDAILKNLEAIGFYNRGVKERTDLLNMNNCRGRGVSYALLETCFISNADDVNLYLSQNKSVARAVLTGIISGFGLSSAETEGGTLYRVQVGAFANKANAETLREELKKKGYEAFVTVG